MDKVSDQGFLGRWSRLKRGEEAESSLSEGVVSADGSLSDAVVAEGRGDDLQVAEAPPLTDDDMPDPDSLDEASDFTGFLSEGVSEALRRRALKKLFHLPEFNIRDGLNEYDEDYSTFIPLGDTVTYQMKQWLERQKDDFDKALADDGVDAEHRVASSEAVEVEQFESLSGSDGTENDDDDLGEADG